VRATRRIPGARIAALLTLLSCCAVALSSAAAAVTIVEPRGTPTVTANAPITVVASGFAAGRPVFIEQCDGITPSTPNWSPTLNCDPGASPPPIIADAQGSATFPASNPNRAFRPFEGESPQSMFNCMSRQRRAPNNSLPSFTNCQVRVSTNNSAATADQAFFPIVLSGQSVPLSTPSSTAAPTTTVAKGAKRSSTTSTTAASGSTRKAASTGKSKPPTTRAHGRDAKTGPVSAETVTVTAGGAGVGAVSNPGVGVGYLLVAGGVLLAVGTTPFRRRRPNEPVVASGNAPGESR